MQDKRVVVAGGGDAVAWKAELLAAAGAQVTRLSRRARAPELLALVAAQRRRASRSSARAWRPDDLDGAAIAVAEADDEEAARFAAAARSRGVLVNVIDQPAFCDFQFGTIVNRSPVVIGISTDGAAPILGQAIRRRIEAVLPRALGGWSAAAKAFRERLADARCPRRRRAARFWEKFVDVTFISQAEEDERLAELERLARRHRRGERQRPQGRSRDRRRRAGRSGAA